MATLQVSKKLFSQNSNISKAISKARPGDTILVETGVYNDNIVIDKEVHIIADGNVEVYSDENNACITMNTTHASIKGLSIKQSGGNKNSYAALFIKQGNLVVDSCIITSLGGDAVRIEHVNNTSIIRNSIIKNSKECGLFIYNNAKPNIINCEIFGNTYSNIVIQSGADPVISGCKIYQSKQNGIWVNNKAKGSAVNCEIYDNIGNVFVDDSQFHLKSSKVFVTKNSGITKTNGLNMSHNATGTIDDCEFYGNGYPCVVVKTGADPVIKKCKIHHNASNGIYVLDNGKGTYVDCEVFDNESNNIEISKNSHVKIESCKVYITPKSNIKDTNGLRIAENSTGVIENCEFYGHGYSSVVIKTQADPIVKGCKIRNNFGTGLFVTEGGKGTIINCDIYDNDGNIFISKQSNPIIQSCRIYVTEGSGINKTNGLNIGTQSSGIIEDCEIFGHGYPAVVIKKEANPVLKRCKIHDNRSNGIFLLDQGEAKISHCEVYDNESINVLIDHGSYAEIDHCQIYTSKGIKTNGIYLDNDSSGIITNCDIYGHGYPNIIIDKECTPEIRTCNIYESKQNGIWCKPKSAGKIISCAVFDNVGKEGISLDTGSNVIVTDIKTTGKINIINPKIDEKKTEKAKPKPKPKPVVKEEVVETELTLDTVLDELNALIGLENVKNEIKNNIQFIQFNKELQKYEADLGTTIHAPHTVLYGNPGTGKTTIAKLLGKLYKAMGLLPSGHVVQVNREKLVAEYIGQTAPKTQAKIDEAIGGVLFIDEAYELTNKGGNKDFGPEAIAVILEAMENRRGEFIVIVAGYKDEMKEFLEINPGLESRFKQYFYLEDYTPEELLQIATKLIQDKKRKMTEEAKKLLFEEFTKLWRKRDKYFANARMVRNHVDAIFQALANRCMSIPQEKWTKDLLLTITDKDVESILSKDVNKKFLVPIDEESLNEALNALNQMIGMKRVKEEIEKLITLVRYYREEGKDINDLSPHTILKGSPGTGKTEVARIIAKIYSALGILERGTLIEVNRDKLVSQYSGETEKITANYINQAIGGVLFIDEAYQLTQYGPQDPGHKVVEVLLKRMEDDRGKFIVLAAGYHDEMDGFLNSNDGLKRRFSREIAFDDYTPEELIKIAGKMVAQRGYSIDQETYIALLEHFNNLYQNRDDSFGNAGLVRNIITEAIKNTDYRVAKISKKERTKDMMHKIKLSDISFIYQ